MIDSQWNVVFGAEEINDLVLITEYLTKASCGFGEPVAEYKRHAQLRIEAITAESERLATASLWGSDEDEVAFAEL